jgi:hypothetical protein
MSFRSVLLPCAQVFPAKGRWMTVSVNTLTGFELKNQGEKKELPNKKIADRKIIDFIIAK